MAIQLERIPHELRKQIAAAALAGSFAAALAIAASPAFAGPKPSAPTWTSAMASRSGENDCAAGAGTTCAGTSGRLPGQCLEIRGQGHLRSDEDPEGHGLAQGEV